MLDHVAHLKELLDYFTFMHEKTATDLINGILPLVKFSHDLQVLAPVLYFVPDVPSYDSSFSTLKNSRIVFGKQKSGAFTVLGD